ncbi:MAG: hypothetical protein ACMXYB_03425 [Candidatus Woesearchaeota archaeon]
MFDQIFLNLEFYALTSAFLGKILLAVTALLVHRKIEEEGKIDSKVLFEIHIETIIGYFAIVLFILGYVLHMINLLN